MTYIFSTRFFALVFKKKFLFFVYVIQKRKMQYNTSVRLKQKERKKERKKHVLNSYKKKKLTRLQRPRKLLYVTNDIADKILKDRKRTNKPSRSKDSHFSVSHFSGLEGDKLFRLHSVTVSRWLSFIPSGISFFQESLSNLNFSHSAKSCPFFAFSSQ